MKKILGIKPSYLLAALALVLAIPSFSAEEEKKDVWSYFAEYAVSRNAGGDTIEHSLYTNVSTKLADKYKLTVEVLTEVADPEGSEEADMSIGFLRFLVTSDPLSKWGDWDFGIDYRYRAPVTTGMQNDLQLGRFKPRFWISQKFGEKFLKLRVSPIFYLNRFSTGATGKPLPQFAINQEIIFGMPLPWGLDTEVYFGHANWWYKAGEVSDFNGYFEYEVEVGYGLGEEGKNGRVAVGVSHSSSYGPKSWNVATGDETESHRVQWGNDDTSYYAEYSLAF